THMLDIQRSLQMQGILISFSGRLSQALIVEYGEAVKKYLEIEDKPQNEIFNIFSIFIEQTQNINNYCAKKSGSAYSETIAQSSIVTIGKTDDKSYVCSGNIIEKQDQEVLTSYIETIIHMDKKELKAKYKEKLKL